MSSHISNDDQPAIETLVSRLYSEQRRNAFIKNVDILCVISLCVLMTAFEFIGVFSLLMPILLGIACSAAVRRHYRGKKLKATRQMWAKSICLLS